MIRLAHNTRLYNNSASALGRCVSIRSLHITLAPPPVLPTISVLRLDHLRLPIAAQLRIEEALLRGSASKHRNFFLINQPPQDEKTIVMGISNKTELLVNMDASEADSVKLLRRFSGGGTVFIDQNCFMVTMIVNKAEEQIGPDGVPVVSTTPPQMYPANASSFSTASIPPLVHPSSIECFPNRLMDWTRDFYKPVFNPPLAASMVDESEEPIMPEFNLTGSDYVFASRKFGGNAQTITKRRWLHHTSFLWTLNSLPHISRYLQNPKKQPEYRSGRSHSEFLVSLSDVWHDVHERLPPEAEEMRFQETNEPSDHEIFQTDSTGSDPFADIINFHTQPDVPDEQFLIPSALPSRLLWRLSHFFELEYPPLDEIARYVEQYDAEAATAIKQLDYAQERERARKDKEEEMNKQAAQAASNEATR